MGPHFKELDLIPEQFLPKKEEMVPILENCLSNSCLEEGLAEHILLSMKAIQPIGLTLLRSTLLSSRTAWRRFWWPATIASSKLCIATLNKLARRKKLKSTSKSLRPVGLVLHVGEVSDRSMMDAAAEHKQKKGVMEVEVSDTD
ncbi:hypothetical protein Pyn_02669 [Prunus yedoensis var. nudiflora]|uniref:Uncharacterized protein n=1 Tax=Prunus yedoensis var. nudiflora TaxID=2094558 RepID=A0A314Z7T1_PRUYE|nr:hypothetical protein Pyn_02669 [Prunus yedoensis var. nudiflora]